MRCSSNLRVYRLNTLFHWACSVVLLYSFVVVLVLCVAILLCYGFIVLLAYGFDVIFLYRDICVSICCVVVLLLCCFTALRLSAEYVCWEFCCFIVGCLNVCYLFIQVQTNCYTVLQLNRCTSFLFCLFCLCVAMLRRVKASLLLRCYGPTISLPPELNVYVSISSELLSYCCT